MSFHTDFFPKKLASYPDDQIFDLYCKYLVFICVQFLLIMLDCSATYKDNLNKESSINDVMHSLKLFETF